MAPPATPDPEQCQRIITALIRPVLARDAELTSSKLVERFGSFRGVLAAGPLLRQEVLGQGHPAEGVLSAFDQAHLHALRQPALERANLREWPGLLDYLSAKLAYQTVEQVWALYVDSRVRLIKEELHATGAVDEAAIYVRELLKRALELSAAGLFVVHNHPSGDPKPSRADVARTRELAAGARGLGIDVHDHLIIGREGVSSMRAAGLL